MNVSFLVVLLGLLSLCLQRKQLIVALIDLEGMSLGLFTSLVLLVGYMSLDVSIRLFFITFRVCEAVLGLTLLTSIIRYHGKDYLSSINLSKC